LHFSDLHFNVTVRHAFKVRCLHRDKWFLFAARSAEEKGGWLQSLRHLQQQHLQQQDWHLFSYDSPPSTSTLNFQRPRHKMSALAKRSKGSCNIFLWRRRMMLGRRPLTSGR
jgi:hypothetical protein